MKVDPRELELIEKKILKVLLFFLSIIIIINIIVDGFIFSNQIQRITSKNALMQINKKENYLQKNINKANIQLNTIKNSSVFNDYINNNTKKPLEELFLSISKEQKNIMQLRYIDKNGNEKIRVDREALSLKPIIIKKENLQNKASRDYFLKSKNKNEIWFSSLDLNIEYGKVQKPYNPTFRAVLPIKKQNKFSGIIIINYFMNDLLKNFIKSELYSSILIDKDNYTLIHFDENKSWGKYKTPQIRYELDNNSFTTSKKLDLPLEGELTLILNLKEEYVKLQFKEDILSTIISSIIILIFSLIGIFLVSKTIKKIFLEFSKLSEFANLIDENIISSSTDLKGYITHASKAFCEISGYTKDELIGQSHNINRHPDESVLKYKQLWKNLSYDKVWEGELKNIKKDGETYWVKAKIYPIYEDGKKVGYTAIRHDITDKKLVEQLSIRDGLTKLYNRNYFEEEFPKFLNNSKRNRKLVSFLIIDIDYFKNYNDKYGHLKGDEVLVKVAKILNKTSRRSTDFCFRIGGEEFVILFNPKSKEEAIDFAQFIRKTIESLKIPHLENPQNYYLTISLGLITSEAIDVEDQDSLYKDADELLYEAKKTGRNKLVHN